MGGAAGAIRLHPQRGAVAGGRRPAHADVVADADVVVTMGYGETCLVFPGKRYEDWQVADLRQAGSAHGAAPQGHPGTMCSRCRRVVPSSFPTAPMLSLLGVEGPAIQPVNQPVGR